MNQQLDAVVRQVGTVILGKQRQIRLAITCLLARGHLLIEDIPGVGKTMLAHTLALSLGLQFQRIQFTSDLLPADILGVSIFDREASSFRFHPGPIFAQVILADEVNRATPKTQSALLEAMEEHQVTAEGETRPLPEPFFVIATQNPSHQIGTFPLPESQLDRFLMRIELGYPDAAAERALLQGVDRRELLPQLTPCMQPEDLVALQRTVREVHASGALLDYLGAGRFQPQVARLCQRAVAARGARAAQRGASVGHDGWPQAGAARGCAGDRSRCGWPPALRRARQHAHQRRRGRGAIDRGSSNSVIRDW